MTDPHGFRSAEAWLRERGVRPEPLTTSPPGAQRAATKADTASPEPAETGNGRHAQTLTQTARDDEGEGPDGGADVPSTLQDDVAVAMGFLRRSANAAPQSEGRLRDKLIERGCSRQVIDLALSRARRERLVDDDALAAALVEERRRRGHAPARIRRDLRARGFDDAVLAEALKPAEAEDLDAAAFAVALQKAERTTGVAADAALRRVVSHVQRRGYPDGVARKVAREAVFSTRQDERTAER